MKRHMACAFLLVLFLAVDSAQGQFFSGPSGFSQAPSSQLGPVTNNLVLTDNANGFVVSGQVLVTVPAGLVAGTLVSWEVDRAAEFDVRLGHDVHHHDPRWLLGASARRLPADRWQRAEL